MSASLSLPSNRSQLDILFRQTLIFSKMFKKSWASSPEILKILYQHSCDYAFNGRALELVERNLPKMFIENDQVRNGIQIQQGWFISPMNDISSRFFESGQNVSRAFWRGYFPGPNRKRNGLIIHLAPTGDDTYWRRYNGFVKPLLALGVSSILLQNPFYGERKPSNQFRSSLLNVSDLFVMGGSLILECCFLTRWAREQGFSPIGISGVSMGGHMASLAVTNIRDKPISLIPLLSWTSASPVFTQGALAEAIGWKELSDELETNKELEKVLCDCGWLTMMEDQTHPAYKLFPKSRAHRLMWILMDAFTNLANYPAPINTDSIRVVVAEDDAYVPRSSYIPDISDLWPGVSVSCIPGTGHVGAYLGSHKLFQEKILEAIGYSVPARETTALMDIPLSHQISFALARLRVRNAMERSNEKPRRGLI
ncbi:unnamed protein product [Meloidogyne enterolobii]|uniref:Uncharacterized protein n=1 Tax=Meloidogyne enterolobii TaxID=390850 RepID=A0ACB0YVI0_MELEN